MAQVWLWVFFSKSLDGSLCHMDYSQSPALYKAVRDWSVCISSFPSLAHYGGGGHGETALNPPGIANFIQFQELRMLIFPVAQGLFSPFSLLFPLPKSGFCLNGTASVKPSLFILSCYSLLIFSSIFVCCGLFFTPRNDDIYVCVYFL